MLGFRGNNRIARLATTWFALLAGFAGMLAHADEIESNLRQNLQHRITATWQGQPLRSALNRLAEQQQISVWLDRRVDPSQTLDLSIRNIPLHTVLERIAQRCGLRVTTVASVAYMGPQDSAAEIAAIREMLRASLSEVPLDMRRRWLQKSAWSWSRLSEPRNLLRDLFRHSRIELRGIERVPHDLWDARQLPTLALVDRAVLLLVGFDLAIQIAPDGKSCEIAPIERPITVTRQYRLPTNRQPTISQLRTQFRGLTIKQIGSRMHVTGDWEDQQRLKAAIEGRSASKPSRPAFGKTSTLAPQADLQVYSLRVREKPVGQVLKQLAAQLQLELTWDDKQLAANSRSLNTRISCELKSASLDGLLEGVLKPAGLSYRREGNHIRIEAKQATLP